MLNTGNDKNVRSITKIKELGDTVDEINNHLAELSMKKTKLQIGEDQLISPECLMTLLDSYGDMRLSEYHANAVAKRKEGIKKALIRKKEGKGSYGRPPIKIPHDFEERVIEILHQKGSLKKYQMALNMGSSTFYKYAGRIAKKYKGTANKKLAE